MNVIIRPLTPEDEPFLWEMLYEAVYVPEGEPRPPRKIVRLPEIARYVQEWATEGGYGFLAGDSGTGQAVGAAWLRLLTGTNRGFGYVNDATPELCIAVLPGHRGRGIGTQLLARLFESGCGYATVSLSVSMANPALRLYQRFGFEIVGSVGDSYTMIKTIRDS
ncbi:MAG TPA: N-acetyltransferase [bacterium]|nr:N-acetyltransferase [bacterium]